MFRMRGPIASMARCSIASTKSLRWRSTTMRIHDPLKQWKLSPMDVESRARWEQYTKAKEMMLERTHIPEAPWWIVDADDKKKARLNCISHLLSQIPYQSIHHEKIALPPRVHNPEYHRGPIPQQMYVPAVY